MVLERPIQEFGVTIVCDTESLRILDEQGNVIEERPVEARTYMEIAGEVNRAEEDLIQSAQGMEASG